MALERIELESQFDFPDFALWQCQKMIFINTLKMKITKKLQFE